MGLVLSAATVRGWTTGSGMEGPFSPLVQSWNPAQRKSLPSPGPSSPSRHFVNSVRLTRHVANNRQFCGTALVEFSTEEDATKVLKQSLVYAGVELIRTKTKWRIMNGPSSIQLTRLYASILQVIIEMTDGGAD